LVFEKRVSRKDAKTQRKVKREEEKFFKVVSFVHSSLIYFLTQHGKLFASPRLCVIFFEDFLFLSFNLFFLFLASLLVVSR